MFKKFFILRTERKYMTMRGLLRITAGDIKNQDLIDIYGWIAFKIEDNK